MGWMDFQIDYLLLLQSFREYTGGIFDNFFLTVTHFGESTYPLFMIAGIYWCINSKLGMYIYWNLGLGTFICDFLKNIACIYRPWIIDSRVQPVPDALKMAHGYSFPSGHTQNAVSVWGSLAYHFKNKFLKCFLILLILTIAFSRNYLGVHTPQDVVVSLIVTTVLIFSVPKIMKWVQNGEKRDIYLYLLIFLLSVSFLVFENFKTYPMDYIDGKLLVDPLKMRFASFPKTGMFLGIFTGWLINKRCINYDGTVGTITGKIVRFFIGISVYWFILTYAKDFYMTFLPKTYAMFLSSFSLVIYATVLYPLCVKGYYKLRNGDKNP